MANNLNNTLTDLVAGSDGDSVILPDYHSPLMETDSQPLFPLLTQVANDYANSMAAVGSGKSSIEDAVMASSSPALPGESNSLTANVSTPANALSRKKQLEGIKGKKAAFGETPKRGRVKDSTSSNDPTPKKSKSENKPNRSKAHTLNSSYADIAKLNLRVSIRRSDRELMDQTMVGNLLSALYSRLDVVPAGPLRPLFEKNWSVHGILFVDCTNKDSVQWLLSTIRALGAIDGVELVASTADEEFRKRRVTFRIADPDKAKPGIILKRLMDSNPGLDTSGWSYINCVNRSETHSVHMVAVDTLTLEYLEAKQRRLHYMFGSVLCDVRGPCSQVRPSSNLSRQQPAPSSSQTSKGRKRKGKGPVSN
ncbi:hypothetical protein PVAND_012327 [Polypedilum vanderplanki]|uniref:DUF4780 domain-containing protein n=1 Tax=Polypedilum vanderplanki TaxID=319348 RepID=A0A9J6CL93_POLVA|nr:hypothetical protein PVAND_012327 [Polypedilum vanderplanki]